MAKRETPLFVLDRSRNHKLGECDFIVCTDIDNGFIARIDYVEDTEPCATDTLRIGNENNGISLKIEVKRIFGKNPKNSQIRTLLSQADKYIQTHLHYPCNIDEPTDEECINFLDLLIKDVKSQMSNQRDLHKRYVGMVGISMYEAIKEKIRNK